MRWQHLPVRRNAKQPGAALEHLGLPMAPHHHRSDRQRQQPQGPAGSIAIVLDSNPPIFQLQRLPVWNEPELPVLVGRQLEPLDFNRPRERLDCRLVKESASDAGSV